MRRGLPARRVRIDADHRSHRRCRALRHACRRWLASDFGPEVASELLALAYITTPPSQARWYVADDGRHAACLPPDAGATCGHVLHTFQPQIHRMWSWSGSATRSEVCPAG
ncbi:hypothetical protein BEN78_07955 [Xanthomonas citri pv. mangiferaeindicae]|nr:hypothetical protein BEN78_07955 [Xanthomonas citri pv. mangiferaeindicae]